MDSFKIHFMKPTVLSSEIVHKNPWNQIRRDKLVWDNDGRSGEYFVTEIGPGVIVVAVEDGKVLTVEQYRHPLGRTSIELIAGKCHQDEDPQAAAFREFQEESGYEASEMIPLGTIDALAGITDSVMHIFFARGLRQTVQNLDESEQGLRPQWILCNEWERMIQDGRVRESLSIASWMLYTLRKSPK